MESSRHLVPSKEHDGNEDTLHEECHDALYGKRCAEDISDKPGIVAPVRSELKLKDNACGYSHGEIDAEQFLPEYSYVLPERFATLVIACLHDAHYKG